MISRRETSASLRRRRRSYGRLDIALDCPHTASMTPPEKGNLPRLERQFYQGRSGFLDEHAGGASAWLAHARFPFQIQGDHTARSGARRFVLPSLLPDARP